MGDDGFHSLNKGVFVLPFHPEAEADAAASDSSAGPSSAPLAKTYADANRRFEQTYWDYEEELTEEQLEEISAWLARCAAPPLLTPAFPIHRLPLALVQNLSPSVAPLLGTLDVRATTVNGQEMGDLAAATRAVAVGFLGDAALAAKKAGRTPIDEVERWWKGLKDESPLLVHVNNAQQIPATVLSELIYILTLHRNVPFRLLVSVPSIAVFTSTRSYLEPGEITLSILSAGRSRRRGAAVNAILQTASDPAAAPISISDDVRDSLRREEDMFGGGAAATLKSLKWLLLHHSHNSPLAAIAADEEAIAARAPQLRQIIEARKEGTDVEGEELFTVDSVPDLQFTQNPAPRLSILQALAKPATFLPPPATFLPPLARPAANGEGGDVEIDDDATPRKSGDHQGRRSADNDSPSEARGRKRKAPDSPDSPSELLNGHAADRGGSPSELTQKFKEIEMLHALWRSAGKSINLWDWLEGFRAAMSKDDDEHGDEQQANGAVEGGAATAAKDEAEQAQHATFVRFIEESRLQGVVRARGSRTQRRTDEVVKGVLMI